VKSELKEKCAVCHFSCQEPYIKSPGIQPGSPHQTTKFNCLSYDINVERRKEKGTRKPNYLFI
jgi:hypothetical protein